MSVVLEWLNITSTWELIVMIWILGFLPAMFTAFTFYWKVKVNIEMSDEVYAFIVIGFGLGSWLSLVVMGCVKLNEIRAARRRPPPPGSVSVKQTPISHHKF